MRNITLKNHFPVLGLCISLISLLSCGKDKEQVPPAVEEMLTSAGWHFESITNVTLTPCQKTSTCAFAFTGDHSYITKEIDAFGNCWPEVYIAGKWQLLSDKTVRINPGMGSTDPVDYEIVEISMEKLVLKDNSNPSSPVTMVLDKTGE